jgi:PEP-CTERM motif
LIAIAARPDQSINRAIDSIRLDSSKPNQIAFSGHSIGVHMKRMRRILFVGLCLLSSLTGALAQEVLLGTTAQTSAAGDLYRIDPSTGAGTLVGPLVDSTFNPYAVTGLAFDNVTGILYGSISNQSFTGPRDLVAIDPNSGAVTVIGAFGIGSQTMADLTFDITTATLYGTGSQDGNLYSVDPTTGLATAVGSSGLAAPVRGNGMAANSAGQIFGSPKTASGALVQFNKSTGAATTVATLSGAPFSAGAIGAMAFNSGGTLYAVNISDTTNATHLVTIDDATGAVTDVGVSVTFLDAIVFFNPTAVPEPTTIVMMCLGFGCLAGLMVLRRRRA